jgi:uncharacterized membrane protein
MFRKTFFTSLLLILFSVIFFSQQCQAVFGLFSQYSSVKVSDGVVEIPVADVNDGNAHYYVHEDSGQDIKFFVLKSRDGVIRAAFDACDVCYKAQKGYSQEGDFMVCTNCGQRFHSTRINVVEGGCNPAPLQRIVSGNQLIIIEKDILLGARFF